MNKNNRLEQKTPYFTQTNIYNEMYTKLKIRGIFKGCNLNNLGSILEIGCGKAREISYLKKIIAGEEIAIGLDLNIYKEWRTLSHIINFTVANAHYLPFKSGMFNLVFLKDVLHHIPQNRLKLLKEAFRCVKDGGLLRVIEANRYNINSIIILKNDRTHQHFTRRQLYKIMNLFSFDELYGYELLPSFSPFKKDFFWNIFAGTMFLLTNNSITRRILFLYISLKEHFLQRFLRYYVISKYKK